MPGASQQATGRVVADLAGRCRTAGGCRIDRTTSGRLDTANDAMQNHVSDAAPRDMASGCVAGVSGWPRRIGQIHPG
jgi:hypothetical protein